jgi:CheY-like chemotaxis protein
MSFTVMIIDDDPVTLFLHKTILQKSEFSVTPLPFSNGKESLDFLRADYKSGNTYLIFLDINMPVMNGWQLIEALNENECCNSVFVVMVSSSIDVADFEKANTYKQVVGYLEKPVSIAAINQLRRGSIMSGLLEKAESIKNT